MGAEEGKVIGQCLGMGVLKRVKLLGNVSRMDLRVINGVTVRRDVED